MDKILLLYVGITLLSNGVGLSILNVINPLINDKIKERGYVLEKNRDSLYEFNRKIGNTLKFFVPFGYLVEALRKIDRTGKFTTAVEEAILSGRYRTLESLENEKNLFFDSEIKEPVSLVPEPKVSFEKPEKYKASKIDFTLYDTYETPIEYITREMSKEEEVNLTPFISRDSKEDSVHNEVTTKDVAKHITNLDKDELKDLRDKIDALVKMQDQSKKLTLDDVA